MQKIRALRSKLSGVMMAGLLVIVSFYGEAIAKNVDTGGEQSAIVSGYSTRYATIDLSVGSFMIDRGILRANQTKLKSGVVVFFHLDLGNKKFPDGIVTQLRVLKKSDNHCPPFCL